MATTLAATSRLATLRPAPHAGAPLHAFTRPLRLLRRHWVLVLVGALCVPLHAAVMLAMPQLLGRAVDGLKDGKVDRSGLAALCGWLLLLAFGELVTRYVSRRTLIDVSRNV